MALLTRRNAQFAFLNIAHSLDHMFILIYTTVVLSLETDPLFAGSYGTLLTLSVWSFLAFGLGSLPAGWLGDKWLRTRWTTIEKANTQLRSPYRRTTTLLWEIGRGKRHSRPAPRDRAQRCSNMKT